ncbi:hypothetical protein NMY22_g6885 [Coprinellus aureogranulatus]|nr:hypothetical protein NMY22_g6885 [Coprinellus aureogranulatus]
MCRDATDQLLKASEKVAVDNRRRRLRDRVEELQNEIRELNSFHNSLSPATLLPVEILSAIFLMCRDWERSQAPSPGKVTSRWIYLTHVCHRWRAAAIDCAALWSSIVAFSKVEFAKVMLERSKTAPLTIGLRGDEGKEGKVLLIGLLKNAQRLRHVDIRFNEPRTLEVHEILSHLYGPAPLLEDLSVLALKPARNDIPPRLLERGELALKRFSIHGCNVTSWPSLPSGPSLTQLDLDSKGFVGHRRPEAQDLYSYLARLPFLRTLALRGYLPKKPRGNAQPQQPSHTSLSALENLVIDDGPEMIANFFAFTRLPHTKSIELFINTRCTSDALRLLLATLSTSWRAGMEGGARTLDISARAAVGPKLSFSFRERSSKLGLLFTNQAPSMNGLVSLCSGGLDLKPLDTLNVFGAIRPGRPSWESFSRLPSLRCINFHSTDVSDFTYVFGRQFPYLDDAQTEPRFPLLAEVSFDRVQFDPQKTLRGGIGRVEDVEDLIRGVTWRLSRHIPIQRLRLSRCSHFFKRHYDRIREAVPGLDLCWDNVQTTSA